jgi:hypothetical protein
MSISLFFRESVSQLYLFVKAKHFFLKITFLESLAKDIYFRFTHVSNTYILSSTPSFDNGRFWYFVLDRNIAKGAE